MLRSCCASGCVLLLVAASFLTILTFSTGNTSTTNYSVHTEMSSLSRSSKTNVFSSLNCAWSKSSTSNCTSSNMVPSPTTLSPTSIAMPTLILSASQLTSETVSASTETSSETSSQSEDVMLWGSVVGILCAVLLIVGVALVLVLCYARSSCRKSFVPNNLLSRSYPEASSIYVLEPTRMCNNSNPSQSDLAQVQQVQLRQHTQSRAERCLSNGQHAALCNGNAREETGRRLSDESHSYEDMSGNYNLPDRSNFASSRTNGYACSSLIQSSFNMGNHLVDNEPKLSSSLPAESFHKALIQCHSSPPTVSPNDEQYLATVYALERRDSSLPRSCTQKEKATERLDEEEDYFADARVLKEIRSSIRRTNH